MLNEESLIKLVEDTPGLRDDIVKRALDLAKKAHRDQKRDDGSTYLEAHIYPVASNILTNYRFSTKLVILFVSGLLHDVLEDSNIPVNEMRIEVGDEITSIVEALTKSPEENSGDKTQEQKLKLNEQYLKRVIAGGKYAIICKIEDRLQNLSCIKEETVNLKPEKYKRYIKEVKLFYLPLVEDLRGEVDYRSMFINEINRIEKLFSKISR